MNEKNLLIDDYIDVNELKGRQFAKDDSSKLEENFGQKCSLTGDDLVEGDDEQTDEDGQQLNSNGQQISQRRRRKSSGKSKLTKIMQSSFSSNGNNNTGHPEPQSEDPPQSSCSSLSSEWVHLEHQNLALNQVNKNLKHNLTSSCDTISEDEHRKNKRNQRSIAIDDDIVSSSNDDVDGHFSCNGKLANGKTVAAKLDSKAGSNKLDKKSKQPQSIPSCDSLSSSPTNNVSYDSSSPIKSAAANLSAANNKLTNGNQISQNKENHLFSNNVGLDKRAASTGCSTVQAPAQQQSSLVQQPSLRQHSSPLKQHSSLLQPNHHKPTGKMSSNFQQTASSPPHQCLNCHQHHNNNYITVEEPEAIPWLYNFKREEAERFLQKFINFDGLFLVRVSSKNSSNFVLSFVHDMKVKHCHIRKIIDSDESTVCFSLDEGKTKFYDLKQLVEFYQLNAYFLPCKLKYFLVHK